MKSRFINDPQDDFDGLINTAGAEIYTHFPPEIYTTVRPPIGRDGGYPFSDGPVEIASTPALTSEAAISSSAQSGSTSAVATTSGGITINLPFDASAMAEPATFPSAIQQAASILPAAPP